MSGSVIVNCIDFIGKAHTYRMYCCHNTVIKRRCESNSLYHLSAGGFGDELVCPQEIFEWCIPSFSHNVYISNQHKHRLSKYF